MEEIPSNPNMSDNPQEPVCSTGSTDRVLSWLATAEVDSDTSRPILATDDLENSLRELSLDCSILQPLVEILRIDQKTEQGRFFHFIAGVSINLGFDERVAKLLGFLWAQSYNTGSEALRIRQLEEMTRKGDFFVTLYTLETFLGHASVLAEILSEWLRQVRDRLGNDGASDGFWSGLRSLSQHRPIVSEQIVTLWSRERPDDSARRMAGALHGFCKAFHPGITEKLDLWLSSHPDEKRRLIFHSSLRFADGAFRLDDDAFVAAVRGMEGGTPEERMEA